MSEKERSALVIGRYLLCDEIAAGGMATVHLGRVVGAAGFTRTVAIKRLHAHAAKDPDFVAMMVDEARIASRIQHTNVVPTIDVVAHDGELLIVMEYVHGESVAKLLRRATDRDECIPPRIALSIIAGALYGLHAAHEATSDRGAPLSVVHRDVSPQNILVGVDGVARVLDFGVAKAAGRLQTTREGSVKGKVPYMSPEQLLGEEVDRRTDIYAAGVVLWEMLVGCRLFRGDSDATMLHQVMFGAVPPPSSLVPGLDKDIDRLVFRGLARAAEDRFPTAREMAEEAQRLGFATPSEITAWVERLAGARLAERARRAAEIQHRTWQADASAPPTASQETPLSAPAELPSQRTDMSASRAAKPLSRSSARSIGLAALAILAGLGLFLAGRLGGGDKKASTAEAPPAPASAAPSIDHPRSAPSATITAAPQAIDDGGFAAPPRVSAPVPATPPSNKPAPRPPSKGTLRCNPPYTIDAEGIRVPKPECL